MHVVKDLEINKFVYDNAQNEPTNQSIDVNNIEMINFNYNDIIHTQFTGGNVVQKVEQLKNDLNLGMYSKAPCGDFINFYNVIGSQGNNYIIYSGVNEMSNSHYIVTVHKILKG